MRGLVEGLDSPFPLALQLPSVYAGDDFAQRLTVAFDDALAPVLSTLDNLAAYFDPLLAPADFVSWLGEWVGAVVEADWPEDRQRETVAKAVGLYRWRGTPRCLAEQVRLVFGVLPEIEESGGAAWSPVPRAALPGDAEPRLVVRLRVPDLAAVDVRALEALVAAGRPAHIPFTVEVTRSTL